MLAFLKKKAVEWLRWSEQYTGTDMVYLVREGGWLTTSKVLSMLGGVALATAFANLVPQDTYGTYKFLVSAGSIIGAFTLSGMGTAVTQAAARGFNGALRHGTLTKLKWSIGMAFAGFTAAVYYYTQGNLTLTYGMIMIAVLYPFRSSYSVYQSFLTGKKDFRRRGIYNILVEWFQVSSMIITLFITNSVLWIFLVFLVTNTVASVFFYFWTATVYPQSDKKKDSMISYSKHLSVIKIFNRITRHIDKVLVWHYLGAVELAIYAFAELPVSKLRTLVGTMLQIAMPKFSEKNLDTLRDTLDYKVLLFALGLLGGAFVYILAAPFLFDLLFSKYTRSVTFTQVYSLSLITYAGRIYGKVLEAHAKTTWLYISQFASNIAKILSLLVFLPLYGIWGGIISLFVWESLRVAISYYGFKSKSD